MNPMGRVFANAPGDLGSIPGRVIPKTLKMVLDTSLLNTQQYKVHIKGKRPPLHLGVVAIKKGAFWLPSTTVANFTFTYSSFESMNKGFNVFFLCLWMLKKYFSRLAEPKVSRESL